MGLSNWLPERRRKQPNIDRLTIKVMSTEHLLAEAQTDAKTAQATAAEAQRKAVDATRAVDSLTDAMQVQFLRLELQNEALLREIEKLHKVKLNSLEFATVPAQGERVEVRRKGV